MEAIVGVFYTHKESGQVVKVIEATEDNVRVAAQSSRAKTYMGIITFRREYRELI